MIETVIDRRPIELVDVTLRDGEQMKKNEVDYLQRIAVFDELVSTGITTFEIGHLGNKGRDGRFDGDQLFASELIKHINAMSDIDERYANIKLQVLFGSQTEIISESLDVLEGIDKDRVIIHVYDRLPGPLRDLATNPYTADESATRVCRAADIALARGYTNFSVSAEGATDCSVDEAVDFYSYIGKYLNSAGAQSINLNLANTYGLPPEGDWDIDSLSDFNQRVKQRVHSATTSVHVHNDDGSSVEFSIVALKAGFDTVEGTLFGMGERDGNVPLCDVVIRVLEIARAEIKKSRRPRSVFRLGQIARSNSLSSERALNTEVKANLGSWHSACTKIADIYGTRRRLENTSFANPEAYNAGSGPHDGAAERALINPAKHPLWRNYIQIAIIHAILGRPEAFGIIQVDPETIKQITVNGSAGGNATDRIMNGEIVGINSRDQAIADAQREIDEILTCV